MTAYWPYLAMVVLVVALYLFERKRPDTVTRIEENILAILLALITVVSFVQVIARYGFNTGWGGALEFTRILFAWMILFGMSYGIKIGSHLGVDVFIRMLPARAFKSVALFGAFCAFIYAITLISSTWLTFFGADTKGGAVHYWGKMYQIGIGLDDLRYPVWMQDFLGMQERVERWVAYLILPIGLALFAYRSLQAMLQIWQGERQMVIASHEAEDLVAENKDILKD